MTDPTIDNPTEAETKLNAQVAQILFKAINREKFAGEAGRVRTTIQSEIMAAVSQAKEAWTREVQSLIVADKEVRFSHTAVNGDMHMFIDNFHNPTVCPECIQPGLLVNQERIN